ncbi:MAG: YHS domain-containing protein [Dehalococcoidia bacterium]|jgi:Cu+-exporting ATPase|nr:YHS domain-containing protein [Dehalococcoidia bacterium]MDP6782024.1 YHS domain-containing protein [Dehalococcoidia bacterium]
MPFLGFGKRKQGGGEARVKDLVCDMDVDPKTAAASYEHQGKMYHFCAPGCKAAFAKDPEKYISGQRMQM